MKPHRYIIATAIGSVLLLAGCTGDGASEAAPVATSAISVQDNQFEPEVVEVAAGDTVTWNWEGDNDHNVVGDGFQSDVQSDGSFTQRFDEPGTYAYGCSLHGGMRGTVVVTDQDSDGAAAGTESP
jgi:plastocyanin